MTGCHITAHLDIPAVINAQAFHLDGVLLYLWLQKRGELNPNLSKGDPCPDLPDNAPFMAIDQIPVCSDVMHRGVVKTAKFTSRTHDDDLHYLTQRFHRSGGPRKDKLKKQLLYCGRLEWDLIGEIEEITSLLEAYHPSLGAQRAHGLGRVQKFIVEERPEMKPKHVLFDSQDVTRRSLPSGFCGRIISNPIPIPVRPPYWHRGTIQSGGLAGTPTTDIRFAKQGTIQ